MVWEGVVLVCSWTQAVFVCAVPIGLAIGLQLVLQHLHAFAVCECVLLPGLDVGRCLYVAMRAC